MRAVLLAVCVALAGCATGTTLVTGQARAPTDPASVTVYLQEPTTPYEVVGAVASTSVLGVNAQANLDRAMTDIKARAASMGATAVIIDYMGTPGGASPVVGAVSGNTVTMIPLSDGGDREVRGRAIVTP